MLLLEQDTTRKKQINELFLKSKPEFDAGNNKEYEIETIINSAVYNKEAEGYLPGLYYLIFWKDYLEEKSTWKPSSIVMHFWKMISTFYKDHSKKLMAISLPLNSAPLMAKPSIKPAKPFAKQKQSHLTCSTKRVKE